MRQKSSHCSHNSLWNESFQPAGGSHASDRLGQEAPVHADIGAGDETAGSRTGEEQRHADEFGGLAETANGRVTQNALSPWSGRAILVKEQTTILFCRKETGRDGIDPHPVFRPFPRQKKGQGLRHLSGILPIHKAISNPLEM